MRALSRDVSTWRKWVTERLPASVDRMIHHPLELVFGDLDKIASSMKQVNAVGEHFHRDEAKGATHGGALGRENVGTSNHNAGEIPARRKTEVSFAMSISEGLVGPKPMANAVGDGHMVNIP